MEIKVQAQFVVNDIVHLSTWMDDENYETKMQVRFAGSAADGTIFFHVTRWVHLIEPERTGAAALIPRIPAPPARFYARSAPRRDSKVAVMLWRENAADASEHFYIIGDNGALIELQDDPGDVEEVPMKADIGFKFALPAKEG